MEGYSMSEALDDVTSRFIINVPDEELSSIQRVCFQIEQAHWFYLDFIREVNARLPVPSLRSFSLLLFKHCSLLRHWEGIHDEAYQTFLDYKMSVPTCGCIILNESLTKVLLVRGWKASASWGFPKGKINKNEAEVECAVREVLEETGFDVSSNIRSNEYIERTFAEQRQRLYIVTGISEVTVFETRTRMEIGDIKWHSLTSIPGFNSAESDNNSSQATSSTRKSKKFYNVAPFLSALQRWIKRFNNARHVGNKCENAIVKVVVLDRPGDGIAEEGGSPGDFLNCSQSAATTYCDKNVQSQTNISNWEASLKSMLGVGGKAIPQLQQSPQQHYQYPAMPPTFPESQPIHLPQFPYQPTEPTAFDHFQPPTYGTLSGSPSHSTIQQHASVSSLNVQLQPEQYQQCLTPQTHTVIPPPNANDMALNPTHQSVAIKMKAIESISTDRGQLMLEMLRETSQNDRRKETKADRPVNPNSSMLLNLLLEKSPAPAKASVLTNGISMQKNLLLELLVNGAKPESVKSSVQPVDLARTGPFAQPRASATSGDKKQLLSLLLKTPPKPLPPQPAMSEPPMSDKHSAQQAELLSLLLGTPKNPFAPSPSTTTAKADKKQGKRKQAEPSRPVLKGGKVSILSRGQMDALPAQQKFAVLGQFFKLPANTVPKERQDLLNLFVGTPPAKASVGISASSSPAVNDNANALLRLLVQSPSPASCRPVKAELVSIGTGLIGTSSEHISVAAVAESPSSSARSPSPPSTSEDATTPVFASSPAHSPAVPTLDLAKIHSQGSKDEQVEPRTVIKSASHSTNTRLSREVSANRKILTNMLINKSSATSSPQLAPKKYFALPRMAMLTDGSPTNANKDILTMLSLGEGGRKVDPPSRSTESIPLSQPAPPTIQAQTPTPTASMISSSTTATPRLSQQGECVAQGAETAVPMSKSGSILGGTSGSLLDILTGPVSPSVVTIFQRSASGHAVQDLAAPSASGIQPERKSEEESAAVEDKKKMLLTLLLGGGKK